MKTKILLTLIVANLTIGLFAATIVVTPSTPNLQAIIDGASAGDIIEFESGTYNLTSGITITNGVTLISQNGAASTIIDGGNSVRCFELKNTGAVIDGFTIQNANNPSGHGGGVNIPSGADGTVQNCTFKNNHARDGGGVAIYTSGLIQNCTFENNSATYGGGIRLLNGGEVRNCLIIGNTSSNYGGGLNIWNGSSEADCIVSNCTIVNNTGVKGSGLRTGGSCLIENTIIYNNTADGSGDLNFQNDGGTYKNICSDVIPAGGIDCITDLPLFVGDPDFHLQSSSACINTGLNEAWMTTTYDLDGNARIYGPHVDMGCYEYTPVVPPITDTDGDGIEDEDDDFPNDPDKAFLNYFPAAGFGSLAFEDLWPAKGDYDFNDVVVDYRFATVTNAQNYVVDITATFEIKASGAYFHNGFGFELSTANNALKTDLVVTGYDHQESYINVDANGLEEGQDHPTVIVFDDIFNSLPLPGTGLGVNTENGSPFVPFDTITVVMTPTQSTYTANDFDLVEWNPFIIVNMNRGVEVHLKDKPPTTLADLTLFETIDDDSDQSSNRYYVTSNNLPWAIDVPSSFDWPKEKVDISHAYLHFIEWAESLGVDYNEWYLSTYGYRNNSNIYYVPTP